MSTLSFMPWCSVEKVIDVGSAKIVPFERGRRIGRARTGLTRQRIASVMEGKRGNSLERGQTRW
jgi:hypothetical protein